MSQARSLWRLELARTKWSGGFINWYHPMRIRHLTTGRYLGVNENNELILVSMFVQRLRCNILIVLFSFQETKPPLPSLPFAYVRRKTIKKWRLKTKI